MARRVITSFKNPRHETSFGGINKISDFHKISQTKARKVLSGIRSYTLHREGKKPRQRNPFFVYRLRQQIQIDLIEIGDLARANNGVNYLLSAIDVFFQIPCCGAHEEKNGRRKSLSHEKNGFLLSPKTGGNNE